jgi:hypothetical protein
MVPLSLVVRRGRTVLPGVGDVLSADPGLAITIYTAEPGTKSAEALSLLGSWAATSDHPEPAQVLEDP